MDRVNRLTRSISITQEAATESTESRSSEMANQVYSGTDRKTHRTHAVAGIVASGGRYANSLIAACIRFHILTRKRLRTATRKAQRVGSHCHTSSENDKS